LGHSLMRFVKLFGEASKSKSVSDNNRQGEKKQEAHTSETAACDQKLGGKKPGGNLKSIVS